VEQVFRDGVVGDQDVHPAVVIVVCDGDAETLAGFIDAGLM